MADLNILDLPPEMMVELGLGMSPPVEVVRKYGYTVEDYMRMASHQIFHDAVAVEAEKLKAEGWTTKNKMKVLAERLLIDAFEAAKKSDSVMNKLDVAKYLAKISGLEPQAGAVVGAGGGFSVVFNFSGQKPVTIEGTNDETLVTDQDVWPTIPPSHIQKLSPPEVDNSDLSEGVDVSGPLQSSSKR